MEPRSAPRVGRCSENVLPSRAPIARPRFRRAPRRASSRSLGRGPCRVACRPPSPHEGEPDRLDPIGVDAGPVSVTSMSTSTTKPTTNTNLADPAVGGELDGIANEVGENAPEDAGANARAGGELSSRSVRAPPRPPGRPPPRRSRRASRRYSRHRGGRALARANAEIRTTRTIARCSAWCVQMMVLDPRICPRVPTSDRGNEIAPSGPTMSWATRLAKMSSSSARRAGVVPRFDDRPNTLAPPQETTPRRPPANAHATLSTTRRASTSFPESRSTARARSRPSRRTSSPP